MGQDPRAPCSLDERPTDEQAQEAGFKDAQEWITYSVGGRLLDPSTVAASLETLPKPRAEGGDPPVDDMQWWRFLNGVQPGQEDAFGEQECEEPVVEVIHGLRETGSSWRRKGSRTAAPPFRTALLKGKGKDQDQTAQVTAELGMEHPYLLVDVEVYSRERVCNLREDLSKECGKLWRAEALGGPVEIEGLPTVEPGDTPERVRKVLSKHQRRDPKLLVVIEELEKALDPASGKVGVPYSKDKHSKLQLESLSLIHI